MASILIPYERFSPQQKSTIGDIVRFDTSLNVSGPPGSGKTLISLYLVKALLDQNPNRRILVVMFNHSLYGYLKTAFKELGVSDNITIQTKDRLFWELAKNNGLSINGAQSYDEKYTYILNNVRGIASRLRYDDIIVDEVQDLRKAEWEIFNSMTKRIISLGDFNQGVYKTDLQARDVLTTSRHYKLNRIYRFPSSIAKIASNFVSNVNSEEVVDRIEETWPKRIVVNSIEEPLKLLELLKELENRQESKAVICPDRRQIMQLSSFLKSKGFSHFYYSKNEELREHDFTTYTTTLITSHSSKGLEFDCVILFGFNKEVVFSDLNLNQILYVSITRTNNNLFLVQNENTIPELVNLDLGNQEVEEFDDILDF